MRDRNNNWDLSGTGAGPVHGQLTSISCQRKVDVVWHLVSRFEVIQFLAVNVSLWVLEAGVNCRESTTGNSFTRKQFNIVTMS